ncbi:MAG TPA: DUF4188 domain-containing protein [Solirubrobacteraceae bacterium]|jgi:hypothetical protein
MGAGIHRGRFTAVIDEDFVVFLIGMRFNRPLRIDKWLPVLVAMPRMLRWLDKHPQEGLLKWHMSFLQGPMIVQYWRSFEDLESFARNPDLLHMKAWTSFNKVVRASGDVGIWHETYKVRADDCEAIYNNMPRIGLAAAGAHAPIGSTGQAAARRIGEAEVDEPALVPYPNP